MTNIESLQATCNAICSTFYPDVNPMALMLLNNGIDGDAEAQPKDQDIFRIAVRLVMGYVENSRTENGISVSVNADAIKKSIKSWCSEYGLDYDDVVEDGNTVVEDGSYLW